MTCSRCHRRLFDNWEDGWPNHGMIDMGIASQSFAKLTGVNICADETDFECWEKGHPILTLADAQHITMNWGDKTNYRLCSDCQKELFKLLGLFFGFREMYIELKRQKLAKMANDRSQRRGRQPAFAALNG